MIRGGFLDIACQIALRAGEDMKNMFHLPPERLLEKTKAEYGMTPVTMIDQAISKLILGRLYEAFPDHAFTDEEAGSSGKSPYRWYIDPFDGTSNAAPKFRQSVVGLALEHEGQIIVAAVSDPFENTITYAERGQGAFCTEYKRHSREYRHMNVKQLHVVTGRPRERRYAEVDGLWNEKTAGRKAHFLQQLSDQVQNVRMFGSNILSASHVAQGRIEVWLMDAVGGHWDTAPGILLIHEAGGKVTDMEGNTPKPGKYHAVLGTNGELHDEILKVAQHSYHDYDGFRIKK